MVYFATRLSWSWDFYDGLKELGFDTSLMTVFKELPELMELTNSKADFYKDLAIGYLLTLVASGGTIFKAMVSA